MKPKPWRWKEVRSESIGIVGCWQLVDPMRHDRATIWVARSGEATWHTWDARGIGGENSVAASLDEAKDQAIAAIVRQGWAPGGWKVAWS